MLHFDADDLERSILEAGDNPPHQSASKCVRLQQNEGPFDTNL
jgi:hypothetical protein